MPMALLATTDDDSNNEEPKPKSKTKSKTKTSSTTFANSLHGRLLCASQCAYSETRDLRGNPYFVGAGFLQGTSLRRLAPRSGLDACLVGRTVDGIVVAFRGTSGNALEWLQNASIYLRKVPTSYAPKGCRVHEGFYGALGGTFENGVKKAILDLLEEERTERYSQGGLDYDQAPTKIYLTGHSKGGSLASLFALMLYNDPKLPSPELVCSFGAARVGNPAFGAYFDTVVNQITYENDLDIIPFLPPGETTMEDMQNAMEDPEAMMDMIESILGSELTADPRTNPQPKPSWRIRFLHRAGNRRFWNYNPIGKRTYIDPLGSLLHPVPRALDTQRLLDLEGKNFRDLRRAHCSSCNDDDNDNEDNENEDYSENDTLNENEASTLSTCSGGYFAALAPEICEPLIG
eukprot:CAMPEP_0116082836 /NCGR_PEP_ID=MMETSP0327-20121206/2940_1 /TAXON_ID=44447 /ORGANISM="Pseudo-nitzschia delicatissima, Strain B596" /LENGTH=403 /DNA_ID=CAMNT_0003573659 /DNA_START=227 /DNA_END=1438 /DNA_ORIENTATION=+